MGDWFNLISEIAGSNKKIRHFPMSAAIFYGLLCEIKTKITKKMPYTNRATVKLMNHNWSYSSEKAIREIDYKITPLEEGLKETIGWYKVYLKSQNK